ncbi:2,3-diketo-L-gulonate TRAP transporter small permease protein YiaM [Bhargavaea cecembensis DSE10]|uniref:2,3-diketo-L-gulonate TRAP transporter small permease protein YiaM n=1 Tax=Bhargavaea cecembensis DSE10 TaxID=1235279 RepID=M7NHZ6_9BACL|nr:TRAP transporter small permease [Bhargavaea cecembensis]EMR06862.1 2,3-diketo-L-gulonate TRAP transporter small permease protein YiaM [Bhargavaea cecembensis DSE10]
MKVLDHVEEFIIAIAMLAMTVIAFANIIARNFAEFSFSFTEELTINLFVLLTFVGTAMGVRKFAHLGFTLFYDIGGAIVKRIMIAISTIAGLVLFGVLFWYGIQTVMFQIEMGQKTPALGMPQWILTMALPFGALLCMIRTVQMSLIEWKLDGTDPAPANREKTGKEEMQ